jgi:hypothetical protein
VAKVVQSLPCKCNPSTEKKKFKSKNSRERGTKPTIMQVVPCAKVPEERQPEAQIQTGLLSLSPVY